MRAEYIRKKLFKNKTLRLLLPIIQEYGDKLINYINNIDRLIVGIKAEGIKSKIGYLFILINMDINTVIANDFLEYVRKQKYYVDDFVFNNVHIYNLRLLIIKIPSKYNEAYKKFLKGNFSKMYDKEIIEKFFYNEKIKKILNGEDKDSLKEELNLLLNNETEIEKAIKQIKNGIIFIDNETIK